MVEQSRRRAGTKPEAIDGFDRKVSVACGAVPFDSKTGEKIARDLFASHALTGFRLTEFQHVATGRLAAEIMIESQDTGNIGARKAPRLVDDRHVGTAYQAAFFVER